MNIQAGLLKIFNQNQPWVLRLPSQVFGVLTVLGMYFLAKELFKNTNIGLLSSYLTAVSYWHLTFSRISFRAIMSPFFMVWGLYFLLASLRKLGEENGDENGGTLNALWLWAVPFIGGVLYGLGFYSYIAYRITPILILLVLGYFFFKSRKENWIGKFWTITSIFLLATFIVALPIGLYFLNNPADFFGRTSQISVFKSSSPLSNLAANTFKTLDMFTVAGDYNWRQNLSGHPELSAFVGMFFLIGITLGVVRLIKKRDFAFSVIFCWAIIAALPVVISNEGIPHALRSILMIPPIIILSAYGAITLYLWSKRVLRVTDGRFFPAALLILGLIAVETYMLFFQIWANNPATADSFNNNYVLIANEINALPDKAIKIVLVNAGGVDVPTPPKYALPGPPMPTQTVMYMTDTFYGTDEIAKGVYYNQSKELYYYVMPDASEAFKNLNLSPGIHVYSLD